MHQYLEMVRGDIENQSSTETYLTSSIFRKLHQKFNYESDTSAVIQNAPDIETIQKDVLEFVKNNQEFDTTEEILSWQTTILRDAVQHFYFIWDDYINNKLFAESNFSDGEGCSELERTCERLNIDPTKTYTSILEIKHILTDINVNCNTYMDELNHLWKLKFRAFNASEGQIFLKKRYDNELKSSDFYLNILKIQNLFDVFMDYANQLAGADHLLWAEPARNLLSLSAILNGFMECQYSKDPELVIDTWVNELFPKFLKNGDINVHRHGPLHNEVISKLTQATQCLVQYIVHEKLDVFNTRDRIVFEHLKKSLEKNKQTIIQEIEADQNTANIQRQSAQ